MSCATISGYAYSDANNNGLFDAGEAPLPNTHIVLKNGAGVVVGVTDTDSNGFYQFDTDATVDTSEQTITQAFSVNDLSTDWIVNKSVSQFDPSLGTLVSVEVQQAGTISSDIAVENLSTISTRTLSGQVSGTLTLGGAGFNLPVSPVANAGTFTASRFDGLDDFAGTSGHDFGLVSASASTSVTLTDPAVLALYTGLGSVDISQYAQATSSVMGGGNLHTQVRTTASASFSVIYHYIPNNCLKPDTYAITETQPAGYLDGQETAGNVTPIPNSAGGPDSIPVTVVSGVSDYPNNNFGELLPASIGNRVWFDINQNGVQDASESGMSDVLVTLSNGATTTTDADGYYRFDNLTPGNYSVTFTAPDGFSFTTTNAAAATDATDSDADVTTGATGIYTLSSGQYDDSVDAGLVPVTLPGPTFSSLAGYVYVDSNNDGSRAGETPISGATVTLTGTDDLGNAVSLSTTTADDGSYSFTTLRPGTYTLTETQPSAYLDGKDTIGTPGGTTSNDQFSAINLPAGSDGVENNFGELLPAQISGYVYYDANNNGIKEAGEAAIPGTTVTLTGTDDQGNTVSVSTITNTTGFYQFTNLRPGTYALTETQPASYIDGKDTIGTPGGTTSNDQFSGISIAAGTNGQNNNFGEIRPGSISGMVYADFNNNGLVDLGEPGIPNTTVTLTGTNDLGQSVTVSTTTDATGAYLFSNLRPGTYAVTETQPAGYNDGKDTLGTIGAATVGTMTNDKFSAVVIKSDDDGINYNFGELPQAGTKVACGMTATIGFWQNKNGQALIKAMNGSASCTKLGTWLATNFPNLFSTLSGKSNTDVAAYFTSVFKVTGQKLVAQTLAGALAVYVTDSDLAGGTYAKGYGFTVNSNGTAIATYNVGSNGSAAGLTNNTSYTVLTLLQKANAANIFSSSASSSVKTAWNNIFDGINQTGDIT